MSERIQSPEEHDHSWADYVYRPIQSQPTGEPRRMYSQEVDGRVVFKVDTPRVGTDGLREALIARYGIMPDSPNEPQG